MQFFWVTLLLGSCIGMYVLDNMHVGGGQGTVQVNQNEVHIYTSSTPHLTVHTVIAEKHTQ